MAELRELLRGDGVDIEGSAGLLINVAGVCCDSRATRAGDAFFCVSGRDADGRAYALDALLAGASAVICDSDIPSDAMALAAKVGATVARVSDVRRSLALAACRFYGEPSRDFRLVAITGTKGKTTSSYMAKAAAVEAGLAVGLIGTVERDICGVSEPSGETTPNAVDLQKLFRKMADAGAKFAAVEASSQGLAQDRLAGSQIDVGVFTNLYKDHISAREHSDMDDYLSSKLKLFAMCKNAVINADSPYAEVASRAAREAGACVYTFSVAEADADARAFDIRAIRNGSAVGSRFSVKSPWANGLAKVSLPGGHNVSNALAALVSCGLCGIDGDAILRGLAKATARGRAETVDEGQDFHVMVDYAHNAASLESLLGSLIGLGYNGITTVFGCGGDRATDRRAPMGEVSGRLSDYTVVTSDNPRSEEPRAIMADIIEGVKRAGGAYEAIEDRREAIARALAVTKPGGLALIVGKGHETTQTFRDRVTPFDDVVVARECLRKIKERSY